MNIVVSKKLPASAIDSDLKFSPAYHEQRIPSFEVSLLAPNNPEEVSTSSNVQVIQSSAVVSVIASNSSTAISNFGQSLDTMQPVHSAGVVPSHPLLSCNSPSRPEAKESISQYGVIFQDHNYGAPMPLSSSAIPFSSPATCPDDDLPKLIVPIVSHAVKTSELPMASSSPCPLPSLSKSCLDSTCTNNVTQQNVKLTKKQKEKTSHSLCNHYDKVNIVKPEYNGTRCICGFIHDDGYMMQCECCTTWQHVVCYGLSKESLKKSYVCEICDPREVNRSRAVSIQERKIKRGAVKSSSKPRQATKKKSENKKSSNGLTKKKEFANTANRKTTPEPTVANSSPNDHLSREERKLMAIMKQFEQMEKRSREKDERVDDPYKSSNQTSTVPKSEGEPILKAEKKVVRLATAASIKAKPKPRGLTKMLKKHTQKTSNMNMTKLLKRRSGEYLNESGNQSPIPSSPISHESLSRSDKLDSGVLTNSFRDVNSVESGKKRWLTSSVNEEVFPLAAGVNNSATEVKNLEGNMGECIGTFTLRGGLSVEQSRVSEGTPPMPVSPAASPEPVLAPLKKRYVRAESHSSVVDTPVTPGPIVAATAEPSKDITGLLQQPSISESIPTDKTLLDTIPEKNDSRITSNITVVAQITNVPVKNEPLPTKRKVSLKEYKQRIREHGIQPSKEKEKVDTNKELRGDVNCEAVPVTPDIAVHSNDISKEPKDPKEDQGILLDIDNEESDAILMMPLPSDFHLSGGVEQSPKKPEEDPTRRFNRSHSQHRHRSSHHRHHNPCRHSQQSHPDPGSDLRVIIPTKAERVAKLKRVNRWLEDVLKNGDDSQSNDDRSNTSETPGPQHLVKLGSGIEEARPEATASSSVVVSADTDEALSRSSVQPSPLVGECSTSVQG